MLATALWHSESPRPICSAFPIQIAHKGERDEGTDALRVGPFVVLTRWQPGQVRVPVIAPSLRQLVGWATHHSPVRRWLCQ